MYALDDFKKLANSIDISKFTAEGRRKRQDLKVVFFGAGAIGGSVGAWLSEKYEHVYLLDRGEIAEGMRKNGIRTYKQGEEQNRTRVSIKVIENIEEAADADVVAIGVKNYSLPAVAEMLKSKLGDKPIILAMQNGVENQQILPKYFRKVIYCIVSYNAWIDEPGLIGYQKKGPLVIGSLNNELPEETAAVARVLSKGVETVVTDHIADAAHCKLVINLTNSLTTLIGHKFKPISNEAIFQKLLTNLTWEGVQIIRAAGYKESKLGGMPPWKVIWAGANLPRAITKKMFEKNVKKMVLSSMAQDIIQRGGQDSELESINGYLLKLALKHGVKAPFNETVYRLCKQEFAKPGFEPWDVMDVWGEVKNRL